jgi:serine/threonine-protein kinase
MRVFALHCHLHAVLLLVALPLAGSLCAPRHASAQKAAPPAIALSVQPGQVVQLVSLGLKSPVVWAVKEKVAGAAVTSDGRYTAPTVPGTFHVVAFAKAAPSKPVVFTVVVKKTATPPTVVPPSSVEPTFGAERLYPLPGGGVIRMRYVSAGAFAMGNSERGDDAALGTDEERPRHNVTLPGYWIGKCEVTRGQYRQFMKAGGYTKQALWSPVGCEWKQAAGRAMPDEWQVDTQWAEPPGLFKQTDDHPVIGVNYHEAEAFCRWAGLRLPTEAEWEKAARWDGHTTRIYPWGDDWDVARSNNVSDSLYPGAQTSPIARYPHGASPCGALDMIGNVWEWVMDWYAEDYFASSPGTNPQGPATGDLRIIKGGSWFGSNFVGADEEDRLRAAQRVRFDPNNPDGRIGFRCAVTTMPASAK